MAPLVVTLHLDSQSQARFEAERRRYFPPERNRVPAHLTLFHQLPDLETVRLTLAEIARGQTAFAFDMTGLRSLGNGVAYTVASSALSALHARLAAAFDAHLIAQDRQPFLPHVVVQNKADLETARATLAELTRRFIPWSVQALGLDVWLYCSGPWTFRETIAFAPSPGPAAEAR